MNLPVDPALFTAYVLMTISMSAAPGPAVMLVAGTGVQHGAKYTYITIAGILLANVIWFTGAGIGLVTLSNSQSMVFQILRYLGAAYILWLAWKILTTPPIEQLDDGAERPRVRKRGLFTRGFILQITNPKCLVYMAVLLPPFVSPDLPALPQVVIMATVALIAEGVCLAVYGHIGGVVSPGMVKPLWARVYQFVGAILLGGAAALTLMI